jgi:hypothetical protein
MPKRLIRTDPVRGVSVYLDIDATSGDFVFTEVQRVAGLQTRINSQANDWRMGSLIGDTQRHVQQVAELPAIVVHRLMREGIWRDEKAMRKWLNDRDNRAFRTTGGRI